jgi:hypothetical protein
VCDLLWGREVSMACLREWLKEPETVDENKNIYIS